MTRSDAEATATSAHRKDGRGAGGSGGATAPHLFLVMSCDAPLGGAARYSLKGVDEVVITRASGGAGRSAVREQGPDGRVLTIRIPGAHVSRSHARIKRALKTWTLVDEGSRNGTFVNKEPKTKATLEDGDLIECGHSFFLFRDDAPIDRDEPLDLDLDPQTAPRLATLSPELAASHRVLARVAAAGLPVILLGESGTGKEVAAAAVHELSGRSGAFVPVNCGAIPQGLVESHLFGHAKGAFSGATRDELGFFRAADGGTLFLDELGDLPLASQAAFLRALEEAVVTPVGTTRQVPVDVLIVAATHRSLDQLVQRGAFREDLLARLSGFVHNLVPLRERMCDLGLLLGSLLPALGREHGAEAVAALPSLSLSVDAAYRLFDHGWPLNVRELRSCLAAALVTRRGSALEAEDLRFVFPSAKAAPPLPARGPQGEPTDPRAELVRLLTEHGGNVAAVARVLGKAPFQIRRWLDQYELDLSTFRRG